MAYRGKSSDLMPSVAVVPAAGRGERFGGMKLAAHAHVASRSLLTRCGVCSMAASTAVVLVTAPDSQFVHLPLSPIHASAA